MPASDDQRDEWAAKHGGNTRLTKFTEYVDSIGMSLDDLPPHLDTELEEAIDEGRRAEVLAEYDLDDTV
jgi:hypothetical protein